MNGAKWYKRPLLAAAVLLPVGLAGGYFLSEYLLVQYDQTTVEELIRQAGSLGTLKLSAVLQGAFAAVFFGFLGTLLAGKTGLYKPLKLEKKPVLITLFASAAGGFLFSLDYWTFGQWIPELNIDATVKAQLIPSSWIAKILYGGVLEEAIMRLFCMSLAALLIWKLFFRKEEKAPVQALVIANITAALLFALGHLPSTVSIFGTVTPLMLVRCLLFNGGLGLVFGWLYRKFGIQYAMLSHALVHVAANLIWTVFL